MKDWSLRQEKCSNMDKTKIINIVNNVKDISNKDLIESRDELYHEFEKTKQLIIELTRHMEIVEKYYETINTEIGKRVQ